MKTAIIGGGNMGGAIARGIVSAKLAGGDKLVVSHPSKTLREWKGGMADDIVFTTDNSLAAQADMIIIAVKPWILESVIKEIKDTAGFTDKIIVSIVAGITIDSILEMAMLTDSPKKPTVFRIIPNTAISLGQSTTFICSNNADKACMEQVKSIFDTMGVSFIVKENQMSAVTALSSCGIAYILKYIDASINGGIELGIEPQQSRDIVIQTVKGAISLLDANRTSPQTEIDKVTTPGGLTFKGLNAMEENGFGEAVLAGLKASLSK